MRTLRLISPLILLSACAAEPAPGVAHSEAVTCEREYRVGSSIPIVNCAPPKTAAERQQMIDDLRNQLGTTPAAPRSGAGG